MNFWKVEYVVSAIFAFPMKANKPESTLPALFKSLPVLQPTFNVHVQTIVSFYQLRLHLNQIAVPYRMCGRTCRKKYFYMFVQGLNCCLQGQIVVLDLVHLYDVAVISCLHKSSSFLVRLAIHFPTGLEWLFLSSSKRGNIFNYIFHKTPHAV